MLYLRCVYKRMSLGHCGLLSLRKVEEIMVPGFDTELCRRRMNLLGHFEHAYKHAYTWTETHIHSHVNTFKYSMLMQLWVLRSCYDIR